jgi:quercetin dioxygenase-like cupin family protein
MTFINLSDIEEKEIVPGFFAKFLHSANMTVAHWRMVAGGAIPSHQHVHEMIVNVIQGKLQLTIGAETKILEAGMCAIIPSNIQHMAKALTDCYVIDVFYPVRQDYASR